jgi:hypothetical protein
MTIRLELGAFAKPLKEQVGFNDKRIDVLQRCLDAMLLLTVRGHLTSLEADKVERRIVKDVVRAVKEHEKIGVKEYKK